MLSDKELYGNLYMFYKEFLTNNQKQVCEQYFFFDYSLAEIAEKVNISKQAVKDALDKAIANLNKCESILQLNAKYIKFKSLKAKKQDMKVQAYITALEKLIEE